MRPTIRDHGGSQAQTGRAVETHRNRPSIACVVPVRGDSTLLEGCVAALRAQNERIDELIVVDDSPDATLPDMDGARILRSRGRGPYAARNLGWRESLDDIVLFLDVRSRPRPDWARRMSAVFRDESVAVAGSGVSIRSGESWGERAGESHQFFELAKYTSEAFFRPYFPTCNLAVRRLDLVAVDGFRELRSGGDADLCWRILDRPGRRHEAVPEVLMDWIPRTRVRDYLAQSYRYGKSNYALRRSWESAGAPQADPLSHLLLARGIAGVGIRTAVATLRRRPDDVLQQLRKAAALARQVGYRVAADMERSPLSRDGKDGTVGVRLP